MQIAVDLESGELRVIWERYDNSGCMDMRDVLSAYETMFVGMWQYEQEFFRPGGGATAAYAYSYGLRDALLVWGPRLA